jgi:hypothetical protein
VRRPGRSERQRLRIWRCDPRTTSEADHPWFSALRQVVETAFANLCDSFGLKYPGAHTTWGMITRIAAKLAAYAMGVDINHTLGRPDFALATLIV